MSTASSTKTPNYKRKSKVYKALGVVSSIAPAGVIVGLTTELATGPEPGLAINFGIAGLTVVVVGVLTGLGKLKTLMGNRIFFLALATALVYLIQLVAAEMVIGLMSCLGGASLGEVFKRLELSAKSHLTEQKTAQAKKDDLAMMLQYFKNI